MHRPAIKICGVSTASALDAVIKARADYVGLNFYPPSPRYVAPASAAKLASQASGQISQVGVFVDAGDAEIGDALVAAGLDAIQLHGSESPARAAQVRARFGRPVWKVISVATAEDVAKADGYTGAADLILFDARTPKGTLPGGMGLAFDWGLVAGWKGGLPWGLAGGLTPDNVAEAVRRTAAPLVDTSSGVESTPGRKNVDRIAAFCAAARQA